jgi:mRNA interferase MazF
MAARHVPEAGDIVWLKVDPQAGREQAVLSSAAYNGKTSLMICCPMTTRIKGYRFEVQIAGATPSVALADQIKSLDWRVRRATRKGRAATAELAEVRLKARAVIGA